MAGVAGKSHSKVVEVLAAGETELTVRGVASKRRERKETKAPKVATVFQPEKQSAKSKVRRGIPAKPKKCMGMKVRFTPRKRAKK